MGLLARWDRSDRRSGEGAPEGSAPSIHPVVRAIEGWQLLKAVVVAVLLAVAVVAAIAMALLD